MSRHIEAPRQFSAAGLWLISQAVKSSNVALLDMVVSLCSTAAERVKSDQLALDAYALIDEAQAAIHFINSGKRAGQ